MIDKGELMMKKLISTVLAFCLLLSIPVFSVSADTGLDTDNQKKAVLSSLNIMNGDENGDFGFANEVTRAEFTKMAVASSSYRNSVSEVSRTSPFHDVSYTYWGASYIKAALGAGYVSGYPDSTFKPENSVTTEEAITIVLKLLGYTDDDFSNAVWPYGQMSKAEDLELMQGVSAGIGQNIKRLDVMKLFYNALTTKVKDGDKTLLSTFGYTIKEDTVFVASQNEDVSIPANKILTTDGQYKVESGFDKSSVGYKGDLILKNSDTAIAFIPTNTKSGEYTLNAILGDDVLVYEGTGTKTIDMGKNSEVYYKTQKTTLEEAASLAALGDSITVFENEKGDIDYAMIGTKSLKGPYIYKNSLSAFGIPETVSVYIDGEKGTAEQLDEYNIVYYSEEVNTVWAYTKKVTGTYNLATPSKDNPKTVNISGTDYGFENADTYKLFATGGTYNIGDAVTVLIGREGKIAGVKDSSAQVTEIVGYATQIGKKDFSKSNGDKYSSYYIGLVQGNGTYSEFAVNKLYEDYINKIVKVTVSNSSVSVNKADSAFVTGKVDVSENKIGSKKMANSVNIIDVVSTDSNNPSDYIKINKSRIDGTTLGATNVLYCGTNSKNEIDTLFLKNVTGDGMKYGIVTSADGTNYTINCGNNSYTSSGVQYTSISKGSKVMIGVSGGKVYKVVSLTELKEKIKDITESYITTSSGTYKVSENCAVFTFADTGVWQNASFSDIKDVNSIDVYYDSLTDGRIRLIIIK